jgi:peptidoglycan/xylan/chitin deacetylase (PgdA/CDA1 family)
MRTRPTTPAVALALLLGAIVLFALVSASTGAARSAVVRRGEIASPAGRAGVRSASVHQTGRQIQWRVTLAHGVSGPELASGRRAVCLLLERRSTNAVQRRVCLASSAHHRDRLALTVASRSRATAAHRVSATVMIAGPHTVTASFTATAVGLAYQSLRWQVLSSARGRGCPSAMPAGTAAVTRTCEVLFPARRHVPVALHTPKLVGCVAKGPSVVYGGPTDRHEIALTFDDGPWPDPPSIDFVNELHHLGVPATFFEIGDQLSEYDPTGSVQRAMLADGDMIGDHTWTHPEDLTSLSPAEQTSELELTAHAIHRATGFTPCLWRPPYGSVDGALASLTRGLGFLTIEWNIDPRDWSLPGVGSIVDTVLREAQNGGIVEMHFGGGPRYETLEAIPIIVADLRERGYRFVNLVQMLGLREIWR